jgi:hypothetical protein
MVFKQELCHLIDEQEKIQPGFWPLAYTPSQSIQQAIPNTTSKAVVGNGTVVDAGTGPNATSDSTKLSERLSNLQTKVSQQPSSGTTLQNPIVIAPDSLSSSSVPIVSQTPARDDNSPTSSSGLPRTPADADKKTLARDILRSLGQEPVANSPLNPQFGPRPHSPPAANAAPAPTPVENPSSAYGSHFMSVFQSQPILADVKSPSAPNYSTNKQSRSQTQPLFVWTPQRVPIPDAKVTSSHLASQASSEGGSSQFPPQMNSINLRSPRGSQPPTETIQNQAKALPTSPAQSEVIPKASKVLSTSLAVSSQMPSNLQPPNTPRGSPNKRLKIDHVYIEDRPAWVLKDIARSASQKRGVQQSSEYLLLACQPSPFHAD